MQFVEMTEIILSAYVSIYKSQHVTNFLTYEIILSAYVSTYKISTRDKRFDVRNDTFRLRVDIQNLNT